MLPPPPPRHASLNPASRPSSTRPLSTPLHFLARPLSRAPHRPLTLSTCPVRSSSNAQSPHGISSEVTGKHTHRPQANIPTSTAPPSSTLLSTTTVVPDSTHAQASTAVSYSTQQQTGFPRLPKSVHQAMEGAYPIPLRSASARPSMFAPQSVISSPTHPPCEYPLPRSPDFQDPASYHTQTAVSFLSGYPGHPSQPSSQAKHRALVAQHKASQQQSPAELMMAEMETRRPWGERLLEAHGSTTASLSSLHDSCKDLYVLQVSLRDKLFEVQNALKTLPGKEEITEEMNENLPGLIETSMQPIADKLDTELAALPGILLENIELKLKAETGKILDALPQKAFRDIEPPDQRASAEDSLTCLMTRLISSLEPLKTLSQLMAKLEALTQVGTVPKAQPDDADINNAPSNPPNVMNFSNSGARDAHCPVALNSPPRDGHNLRRTSRNSRGRFTALLNNDSPLVRPYALGDDNSVSPNIPPLDLDEPEFQPQQQLYSPRLAPLNKPAEQADRVPVELTVITQELVDLRKDLVTLEARLTQRFDRVLDAVKIQPTSQAIPEWAQALLKQMEEIQQTVKAQAPLIADVRTPSNPAQSIKHILPTPVSSSQPLPRPTVSEHGDEVDRVPVNEDVFDPIEETQASHREDRMETNDSLHDNARSSKAHRPSRSRKRTLPTITYTKRSKRTRTGSGQFGTSFVNPDKIEVTAGERVAVGLSPNQLLEGGSDYPLTDASYQLHTASPQTMTEGRCTKKKDGDLPIHEGLAVSSATEESNESSLSHTFVDPPAARTRGSSGIRLERIPQKKKVPKSQGILQSLDCRHIAEVTGLTTSSQSSDDTGVSDFEKTARKKREVEARKKKRSFTGSTLGRQSTRSKTVSPAGSSQTPNRTVRPPKVPSSQFTFEAPFLSGDVMPKGGIVESSRATPSSGSIPRTPASSTVPQQPKPVRAQSSLLLDTLPFGRLPSLGSNLGTSQNSAGGQIPETPQKVSDAYGPRSAWLRESLWTTNAESGLVRHASQAMDPQNTTNLKQAPAPAKVSSEQAVPAGQSSVKYTEKRRRTTRYGQRKVAPLGPEHDLTHGFEFDTDE